MRAYVVPLGVFRDPEGKNHYCAFLQRADLAEAG